MLALLSKHNHFVLYKIPNHTQSHSGDRLIDQLAKLIRLLWLYLFYSLQLKLAHKVAPLQETVKISQTTYPKQTRVYDAYRRMVDGSYFIEFEKLSARFLNRKMNYVKWKGCDVFHQSMKRLMQEQI